MKTIAAVDIMDPPTGHTCCFLPPRPPPFLDKDLWWTVDINFKSRGGREKRRRGSGRGTKNVKGARPLVIRCMQKYGWSERHARRVLYGYRQFMILIEMESKERAVPAAATGEEPHEIEVDDDDDDDDDLTITFYPCSKDVDLMWQEHILDTTNYIHDCLFLCGRFVGRTIQTSVTAITDGEGGIDAAQAEAAVKTKKRDDNTRRELKAMFGNEYDEKLWTNQIRERGVVVSNSGGKQPNDNSDDDSVMVIDPPELWPNQI